MRWRDIGDLPCSVARALSVVGDRWTLLVLRDAFLGIRRFEDFHADLGTSRRRTRHAGAARPRAAKEGARMAPEGGAPMSATQYVDPSVSRTPLPLDASDLATICVLCSQNCGIRVDVAGGRIVAVRADERNPITTGYICNKGFSIPSYVRHAERGTQPLRRLPDGGFEPIGWAAATPEIE